MFICKQKKNGKFIFNRKTSSSRERKAREPAVKGIELDIWILFTGRAVLLLYVLLLYVIYVIFLYSLGDTSVSKGDTSVSKGDTFLKNKTIIFINCHYYLFFLWMYFAKNQDGYTFAVSPAATLSWGVPRASFYKALQTLKEKKYIVEKSDNTYDFYESPKEEQIVVTINKDNSFVF